MTEIQEPTPGTVGKEITLLDRTITVKPFISLGMDRMRLMARIAERFTRKRATVDDLIKLDKLFAQLLSDEDDSWLEHQIINGDLTQEQVLNALTEAIRVEPVQEKVEPRVRARRGRS